MTLPSAYSDVVYRCKQGRPIGPLFKFFPDGIILGVVNPWTKRCDVNPVASQIIERGDQLVMMRPTGVSRFMYGPARMAKPVDLGKSLPGQG